MSFNIWQEPILSGDHWVRTEHGWESLRSRLIQEEYKGDNTCSDNRTSTSRKANALTGFEVGTQPFILYSTQQRHGFISFSDVIVRLDMANAVKDIRRINYMTQIILLMLKKFPDLSGTCQKLVLSVVEAFVRNALNEEVNICLAREVVDCGRKCLSEVKLCHVGSRRLWSKHLETMERLTANLDSHQISQRSSKGQVELTDLPDECLRNILLKLPNHADVINVGKTCFILNQVSEDPEVWRKLVSFHFTLEQLETFLPQDDTGPLDWKSIYRQCNRHFGMKDLGNLYTDRLALCQHCSKIYWKFLGHPCMTEERKKPVDEDDLTPVGLMAVFHL